MKRAMATILAGCMLTLNTGVSFASEQGKVTSPDAQPHYGILKGKWVRPDGGYTITIKAVDVNGELDASYANPNPLPFSKSVASRDGNTIRVFLELSAGGYNGSTYTLNYVPSQDILKGIYFQAVARQKYEVYFERVSESK
jgi:succinate dehydrogenase/fumarate reductase flavoprotein subunit